MSVAASRRRPRVPPFVDPPGYARRQPESTLVSRPPVAIITPAHRGTGASRRPGTAAESGKPPTPKHVAMSGARRLKRVFGIEIESGARGGGKLAIIASIEEPEVIAKMLAPLEDAGRRLLSGSRPSDSCAGLARRARGPIEAGAGTLGRRVGTLNFLSAGMPASSSTRGRSACPCRRRVSSGLAAA
jgi:hypothetical protein